jgi:hypothetical protein
VLGSVVRGSGFEVPVLRAVRRAIPRSRALRISASGDCR